jgi:prepilin-type N-terminal cleavage/methylation domain-containing protein
MRSLFRKMHKGEKGFTLVELLVVFTLLGILAAIILPSVSGVLSYSHTQAENAEEAVIQTAVDAMMAITDSQNITAVNPATRDWSASPVEGPLYPDYLRSSSSHCTYTIDAYGEVTRVSDW